MLGQSRKDNILYMEASGEITSFMSWPWNKPRLIDQTNLRGIRDRHVNYQLKMSLASRRISLAYPTQIIKGV